jgi:hypothetical protein
MHVIYSISPHASFSRHLKVTCPPLDTICDKVLSLELDFDANELFSAHKFALFTMAFAFASASQSELSHSDVVANGHLLIDCFWPTAFVSFLYLSRSLNNF